MKNELLQGGESRLHTILSRARGIEFDTQSIVQCFCPGYSGCPHTAEKERLAMNYQTPSLAREAQNAPGGAVPPQREAAPITLSERSLLALALMRILVGFLWFQQLAWKMPPTFGGLRQDVLREARYTILPGYRGVIQDVFLAHFTVLGVGIWTAELLVGLTLLFGLFTRLGALLALLLSIQLYLGIAYAPNEWYWAYLMLIMLSACLVAVPAGRRLGCDQVLQPWLSQCAASHRLARLLVRLV
jgi:thiosulfate dehydrogenase [quinone] large subunit